MMNYTGKIAPDSAPKRSLSLPKRQGDPRRKNLWFKAHKSPSNTEIIKQSLRKRQNTNKDKKKLEDLSFQQENSPLKISFGNIFEKQPATPHNTTQFITQAAHLPTESCVFNGCNDRFSQQIHCHSMLGSMRNLILGDTSFFGANPESPSKEMRSCFSENAYDLTKIRSESDSQISSNCKYFDQSSGETNCRPAHKASQIDIKQLLEEINNGRNKLENVIQVLVKQIQDKEDIIASLQK